MEMGLGRRGERHVMELHSAGYHGVRHQHVAVQCWGAGAVDYALLSVWFVRHQGVVHGHSHYVHRHHHWKWVKKEALYQYWSGGQKERSNDGGC